MIKKSNTVAANGTDLEDKILDTLICILRLVRVILPLVVLIAIFLSARPVF